MAEILVCSAKIWSLTGRYKGIPKEQCICFLCNMMVVENEFHSVSLPCAQWFEDSSVWGGKKAVTVTYIIRILEMESIEWTECLEMFFSWICIFEYFNVIWPYLWYGCLISPCGLGNECARHKINEWMSQSIKS